MEPRELTLQSLSVTREKLSEDILCVPRQHWILDSIRGVFSELKESVCNTTASGDQNDGSDSSHLPLSEKHGIMDSVRGIFSELRQRVRAMTAETLNFVELGRSSLTTLDTHSKPPDVEVNCDDCGRMIKQSQATSGQSTCAPSWTSHAEDEKPEP